MKTLYQKRVEALARLETYIYENSKACRKLGAGNHPKVHDIWKQRTLDEIEHLKELIRKMPCP
jgi:histone acetyltransferase (RNA polymerase elongator complex component)